MKGIPWWWLGIGFLLFLGFVPAAAQEPLVSTPATEQEPTSAIQWMELLYRRIEAEGLSAPAASRVYGYAGVTLYEAVRPGIPDSFSTARQLNELQAVPQPDLTQEYDWPTAANGAMRRLLLGLLSPDSAREIDLLYQTQKNDRARRVSAEVIERSLAFGESVADAILTWASYDRYETTRDLPYELPTGDPSLWVPTTPGTVPIEPHWGRLRPFSLYYADSCAVPLRMPFSTEPNSTFYQQAMEVVKISQQLTPEQKETVQFWVDSPASTGTPAGHWVLIQNQLAEVLDLKLDMTAMMYALTNIAMADAFISCWSLKYQQPLLRPVTYIQRYIDPGWTALVETPPFPEYPSGHSVVSSAAAEVLTTMFGTVAFTDRSGRMHGFADRSYTSIEAAAYEASISRLYGGIHYRVGMENGIRQGQCVGQNVLKFVRLRPIPQGE